MDLTQWIRKWNKCKACPLHLNAKRHVLYRGKLPASVLLIGEAPGKQEDKLGEPFVGRSGDLLNTALERLSLTDFCIANVVCCIPYDEQLLSPSGERQVRPPSKEEAAACSSHLTDLLQFCQPSLVVMLGKQAEQYQNLFLNNSDALLLSLRHPSYILRNGGKTSNEFKKFLLALDDALSAANILHTYPLEQINV